MSIAEKIGCLSSNSSSNSVSGKTNADMGVTQSQVTLEECGSKVHCNKLNMNEQVERKGDVKGRKEGLTQLHNRQEEEFLRSNASETSAGAHTPVDTKRRVAVCDATDEAKKSRCHMRVIMKKF